MYLVLALYFAGSTPDPADPISALKDVATVINSRPLGVFLALLVGLVLTAIATQSFEFAAIRVLEGYWGGSHLAQAAYTISIWNQLRIMNYLVTLGDRLEVGAFKSVELDLRRRLRNRESNAYWQALHLVATGRSTAGMDASVVNRAEEYYESQEWLELVDPARRHRLALINRRVSLYPPSPSRLMPTRLGNTLRATEDRLRGNVGGEKLRGYIVRNIQKAPAHLLVEHDQYRNRLDMYAVLAIIAAGSAAIDLAALPAVLGWPFAAGFSMAFVLVCTMSYRGAISAAMDYCIVLAALDEAFN